MGHGGIGRVVVQKALGLPEDRVGIGPGKADRSGLHGFGPFGGVTGDKHGFAQ